MGLYKVERWRFELLQRSKISVENSIMIDLHAVGMQPIEAMLLMSYKPFRI
jgi:hypothetical protein